MNLTTIIAATAIIGVRAPNALQAQLDQIRAEVGAVRSSVATNAINISKALPRGVAYSRIALARELDAIGKWEATKALLEKHKAWDEYVLATWLEADDPMFVAAIQLLKEAQIITQEQLDDILPRCLWTEY